MQQRAKCTERGGKTLLKCGCGDAKSLVAEAPEFIDKLANIIDIK